MDLNMQGKRRIKVMCWNISFDIYLRVLFDYIQSSKLSKFSSVPQTINNQFISMIFTLINSYSNTERLKRLNISSAKDVEYLLGKLDFEQSKYIFFSTVNKWKYNSNAFNSLVLFKTFKAS